MGWLGLWLGWGWVEVGLRLGCFGLLWVDFGLTFGWSLKQTTVLFEGDLFSVTLGEVWVRLCLSILGGLGLDTLLAKVIRIETRK